MNDFGKPIDQLTVEDLRRHPVWEYLPENESATRRGWLPSSTFR
jgi:hypothetical protein